MGGAWNSCVLCFFYINATAILCDDLYIWNPLYFYGSFIENHKCKNPERKKQKSKRENMEKQNTKSKQGKNKTQISSEGNKQNSKRVKTTKIVNE